jgi:predicted nuclease of predicted toxin-antitoxin system
MKLLFDQHLSFKLVTKLEDVFPGSNQVKLVGMHEAGDDEIWEYARVNGFTVVSKDSDYNERSTLLGHPPKVVWLRCGNQPTAYVERLIRSRLAELRSFELDESAGCIEIY